MHPIRTLIALCLILSACVCAVSADIPPMPPLRAFCLDVPLVAAGTARATIVTAADDQSIALGQALVERIEAATGTRLPLAQELPAAGDPASNAVIIGKFDDPALHYLYRNHFILTDARFPGPDGYVVRTVHDPWGDGRSVLLLGGSDLAGQRQAVEAFGNTLKPGNDLAVPHTLTVVTAGTQATPLTEAQIAGQVAACKAAGFRSAASILCSAAMKYHLTGDPGQVELFRQSWEHVAGIVATMDRVTDTRGIFTLPVMWDLIEECPVLSDDDRARISEFVWEYANKCPEANTPVDVAPTPHGNSWNSRANWWAAAYFRRYYDMDVAGLEAWSDNWFAANMASWKPAEDCPGYGSITWYDLMCYLLERPKYKEYQDSGNLRKMADYAMLVTNNLGYVSGFGDISSFTSAVHVPGLLLITAWLEQDGRYLWFYDKTPGHSVGDYMGNQYFVDGIEPEEPTDLLGVRPFELPDWVYENREAVLGTAPSQLNSVLDSQPVPEYEKCFDKISFRDGFDATDEYLLLGGISHGYHAHPDGNSIIGYTDNGKYWLFDNGYFVPDTIEHNTVCVFRDGLFEPVPRLTSLEDKADFADLGITQTQCAGYNGVDWRRNIIWQKGGYFAVIDELEAIDDGSFSFQAIWRTIGDIELKPDRMLVSQSGERFCLINPSMAPMRLAETTPASGERRALIQTTPAELRAGERTTLLNLFYSPNAEGYPFDAVRARDNVMLVRGPEGHALIAAGDFDSEGVAASAKVAYVSSDGVRLLGGTKFAWGDRQFESTVPVTLDLNWRDKTMVVETTEEARITWQLAEGERDSSVLGPGRHEVTLTGQTDPQAEAALSALFDRLAGERQSAALAGTEPAGATPRALWEADESRIETRSVVRAEGTDDTASEPNLARAGKAMCWEEASAGSGPASATDGNMESYSAVSSQSPHSNATPKDIGIEWTTPQTVSQVWVHHHSVSYRPAMDGQDLQYWDGEAWVSIDDQISGSDTATWEHTFEPVETTRLRLVITEFNTMRTAIREFEVFARPVERVDVDVVVTRVPAVLAAWDMNGDGKIEIAAGVDNSVVLYASDGERLWERDLGAQVVAIDAGVLDAPRVVASTSDRKMHCIDATGTTRWSIICAKDKYMPEIEPLNGTFTVLKIGDIDGDGAGEIVAGNTNWFAYAFDAEGTQLWGSLNWAHPALSIALGDVTGEGKLSALIGTRYNDAGLFAWDGKKIGGLPMGYHSCPCATELADLDGDGIMELIGGSRVGGVQANKYAGGELWSLFMGAEVTATVAADLTGDGLPEVLAASRNGYVLCLTGEGEIAWKANMNSPVISVAVASGRENEPPSVLVGVEDGTVHVLSATGEETSVLTTGGSITQVLATDLDGDGKADLVAASADGKIRAAAF